MSEKKKSTFLDIVAVITVAAGGAMSMRGLLFSPANPAFVGIGVLLGLMGALMLVRSGHINPWLLSISEMTFVSSLVLMNSYIVFGVLFAVLGVFGLYMATKKEKKEQSVPPTDVEG